MSTIDANDPAHGGPGIGWPKDVAERRRRLMKPGVPSVPIHSSPTYTPEDEVDHTTYGQVVANITNIVKRARNPMK